MIFIHDLNFKHDWSTGKLKFGKLHCSCFTTIRLDNIRFEVGNFYRVINQHNGVKTEVMGYAKCIRKSVFPLDGLNEWICYLDTGCGSVETRRLLEKIYGSSVTSKTPFCAILLKYLSDDEVLKLTKDVRDQHQKTIYDSI
jgi:hypothetical protein